MRLFQIGFRHRLTGNITPGEFRDAMLDGFRDYLNGWKYARELFPD